MSVGRVFRCDDTFLEMSQAQAYDLISRLAYSLRLVEPPDVSQTSFISTFQLVIKVWAAKLSLLFLINTETPQARSLQNIPINQFHL